MSSISVNTRLRPIRFAFLVRPDDKKSVLEIFRINTCLWGGQFNPIIPFLKRVPVWWERKDYRFDNAKQIVNGYLDFFEPDFIVEAEKGLAGGLGFNEKRVLQLADIIEHEYNPEKDSYGLSVCDLYRDLYRKEFQFVHRHKSNIVNVEAENPEFTAFVACNFGAFPTKKPLKYFSQGFKEIFDPKNITLNGTLLAKLYKSEHVSALRIASSKIKVDYHEHLDPTLFILDATKSRDLIDFWNLRAVHKNVLAIPIQWIEELSPFCKDFITKNHRPLPGNRNGVMIHPMSMFSRSIKDNDIQEIHKKYLRVEKPDANMLQSWYPPIWRPSPDFMVRTTRPTLEVSEKGINLSIDIDKPEIRFDTLYPEFAEKYGNSYRWANVVKLSDWSYKDQIATVFPCNYKNPKFPTFKIGREYLLPTSEGLVIFPQYKNIPER